jgi:hypothetical protein
MYKKEPHIVFHLQAATCILLPNHHGVLGGKYSPPPEMLHFHKNPL